MSHASPDNIDMSDVFGTIRRRLPKLLLLSALMGALTFLALTMVAPRYQSAAELIVSARGVTDPFTSPRKDGGGGAEAVTVRMDKEAINTHVRALLSPELGAAIAKELKLAERVEFNPALGSPDMMSRLLRLAGIGAPRPGENEQDRVLNRFYERLEVYTPKESRAIAIRFTSMDPDLAAAVPNALAEAYRRSLADQSVFETDEVQKALAPKIEKLREEVLAADAATETFRAQANIFKGGQQATGLNEQQLAELTAELSKAQAAKSEADARTRAAREMMKSGSGEAIPEVQKSPLIQNVVQQRVRLERQISELSATLLPGHPRMRQLNADLAGLKKQIAGEVEKVVDSLAKEASAAALRVEAVNKDLSAIKTRVVDTGPDEVKLRQLENEARSKRAELDRLQAQFEANRAKADSRVVPIEAQIVSRARPESVPIFPRKGPFAALAAFATFLFGLAITVTRALLTGARPAPASRTPAGTDRRRSSGDAERRVEPALAAGAMAAAPSPPVAAPVASRPPVDPAAVAPAESGLGALSAVTGVSSMGVLARRISGRASSGGYRTLVAGETELLGVASHATELAKALTEIGHSVILIDWAPEGEGIAEAAGLGTSAGIADLLAGTATFEEVVKRLPASEAHFIASGRFDAGLDSTLDPDRLNLVLDALDEAYDEIVIAGRHEAARSLFEVIEGRVDCGVLIADPTRRSSVLKDPPGTYLGFEVADIDLVRYDRQQTQAPMQRVIRQDRGTEELAQLP